MASHFTIMSTWIEAILGRFEALGFSRADLTEGLDELDRPHLSPYTQIGIAIVRRIWQRAASLNDDPLIGLKVGFSLPLQAMNVLSLIVMHSPTLGEALQNTTRYQRLISNSGYFIGNFRGREGRQKKKTPLTLHYHPSPCDVPLHDMQVDSVLAGTVHLIRMCGLVGFSPIKVSVTGSHGRHIREYENHFGCPVTFNAAKASMIFQASDLDSPMPGADASLLQLCLTHAEDLIKAQDRFDSLSTSVRQAIRHGGFSSLTCEDVAQHMGISTRTLQRRLAQSDRTFRQLVEEAREEEARYLLARSSFSLSDISDRLGYSEPSAFSRAARKWWGRSPRSFREESRQRTSPMQPREALRRQS